MFPSGQTGFLISDLCGQRLAALLLQCSQPGLVIGPPGNPPGQLQCFFPLVNDLSTVVQRALFCTVPPPWHTSSVKDVQAEAQLLVASLAPLGGEPLAVVRQHLANIRRRTSAGEPTPLLNWCQWLVKGPQHNPEPVSVDALQAIESLLLMVRRQALPAFPLSMAPGSAQTTHGSAQSALPTVAPDALCAICNCVLFRQQPQQNDQGHQQPTQERRRRVDRQPTQPPLSQQQQQPPPPTDQFAVIQHSSHSNRQQPFCLVHTRCVRQRRRCPVHPSIEVRRVHVCTVSSAPSWLLSLPAAALVPPVITALNFSWLTEHRWRSSTWELLNVLCDSVLSPVVPLDLSFDVPSKTIQLVEEGLTQLNDRSIRLSRFAPVGLDTSNEVPVASLAASTEIQLARAALYAVSRVERQSTTSSPAVVRLRCVAAQALARARLAARASHEQTRLVLNANPFSPAINTSIYWRLVGVGDALVEWSQLFQAVLTHRLSFSWGAVRQVLTKKNANLVQPRVLLDWQRLGLVPNQSNHLAPGRQCECCQQPFAVTTVESLVTVGDNHWWCEQCRSIQHDILDVGDIDPKGVPSIGLTCYICGLLQMLVSVGVIRAVLMHFCRRDWRFQLPNSTIDADRALLSCVANAVDALFSVNSTVTTELVADVKRALANTINLNYYLHEEQPLSEVLLAVTSRLQETVGDQATNLWSYVAVRPLHVATTATATATAATITVPSNIGHRQFTAEVCRALVGFEGFSAMETRALIVERHGQSTPDCPWDALPLSLILADSTFRLRSFTVRIVLDEANDSAHFVTYRHSSGGNGWLRCDNHQVEIIESDNDLTDERRQADLAMYEKYEVWFPARPDGSPHPNQAGKRTTSSGRSVKRTKRTTATDSGILFPKERNGR